MISHYEMIFNEETATIPFDKPSKIITYHRMKCLNVNLMKQLHIVGPVSNILITIADSGARTVRFEKDIHCT